MRASRSANLMRVEMCTKCERQCEPPCVHTPEISNRRARSKTPCSEAPLHASVGMAATNVGRGCKAAKPEHK
eukprot:364756-Chlamydomonas_euryale.AAC.2